MNNHIKNERNFFSKRKAVNC